MRWRWWKVRMLHSILHHEYQLNISWAARWCVGCPRIPCQQLRKRMRCLNNFDMIATATFQIRILRLYDLADLCTCVCIYIYLFIYIYTWYPFSVERWKHARQSLSTIHQTMHWNISAILAINHSELQLVCTFERWWRGGYYTSYIKLYIYNRDMVYNK